ncbi:unnamed protein product [Parnassius apollo]|uniref:(apollo) hypothetical protein n=1 Tax=Parnassius apollo TaxID=110799 RepID=A0A8S3WTS3_PARAO|nr:unnamed protein product [Parnassius apollo]
MKESQEQLLNAKKEITEIENQKRQLSIKLTTQRDKEQLTSRDKTENNKKNNAFTKQNIFIMGTQQCIGLAAELTKSRMNSRYEDYQVTAFIKPFASTEEVLKICTNLKVDTYDKFTRKIKGDIIIRRTEKIPIASKLPVTADLRHDGGSL